MKTVSLVSYKSRKSLHTRDSIERDLATVLGIVPIETPAFKAFLADQGECPVLEDVCVILLREFKSKVELCSAIRSVLVESNQRVRVSENDDVLVWVLQPQLSDHGYSVSLFGIVLAGHDARSAALQKTYYRARSTQDC